MAMSKSERKLQMRQEAKRKVRPSAPSPKGQREYNTEVEAGRRQLMVKSSEGGDTKAKKVKQELMYLLNNYTPKYDARIEMLIGQWRTSGDPSYDPAIRVKLRQARQQYMRRGQAL
jgi:hypothetical protein